MNKRLILILTLLLLVFILLTSCGRSSLRILWNRTTATGYVQYRYALFTAAKQQGLGAGQDALNYVVTVERGMPNLTAQELDGKTVWRIESQGENVVNEKAMLPKNGRYDSPIQNKFRIDISIYRGKPNKTVVIGY